jgi:hypothetical protein
MHGGNGKKAADALQFIQQVCGRATNELLQNYGLNGAWLLGEDGCQEELESTVPPVFGRKLQCQPVRGVNFREECHWSHACSLQANMRGIQWHPRV